MSYNGNNRNLIEAMSDDGSIHNTPLQPLSSFTEIIGVSLNGVYFFSSGNDYNADIFYPPSSKYEPLISAVKDTIPTFDQCLGAISSESVYGYYMFSPCIYNIAQK